MTVLLATLGVIIAAFGALIAYFQWLTAHHRIVLNLFDRRLAVFREVEQAARDAVSKPAGEQLTQVFFRFVRAESEGRFLFGDDVLARLEAVRKDMAAVMAFADVPNAPQDMIDLKNAALIRLAKFAQDAAPTFAKYMRFDTEIPRLWWPLVWVDQRLDKLKPT